MGFEDNTLNENPWSTNHTWFVDPSSGRKDDYLAVTTFTRFYIQAFVQFVIGWIIYLAFNNEDNTGRFAETSRKLKSSLGNISLKAPSGVCISTSTASLSLAVLYVTVGIVVQILNGDRHASSYSIIVLFLGTCIYRFVRMSRRSGNSWNMVPNLLTIVALSFLAMAYNNVLVESKENGNNALYWISAILFGLSALIQVFLQVMPSDETKTEGDRAAAAYVIPTFDFAVTTIVLTAVLIWELILISLAETRLYATPYIPIYALFLLMACRIIWYSLNTTYKIQHFWNFVILCFVTVTVVFAHINTCNAFPESAGGGRMYICAPHMHKPKPGVRITLFSSFAQISILLFWIGFMNSGTKVENGKQSV